MRTVEDEHEGARALCEKEREHRQRNFGRVGDERREN